jgi:hypothetical protein
MNFDKIPGIWFVLSGLLYLFGLVACAVLAPTGFGLGFAAGGALVLGNAWASARRIKNTGFLQRSGVTALLLDLSLRLHQIPESRPCGSGDRPVGSPCGTPYYAGPDIHSE